MIHLFAHDGSITIGALFALAFWVLVGIMVTALIIVLVVFDHDQLVHEEDLEPYEPCTSSDNKFFAIPLVIIALLILVAILCF